MKYQRGFTIIELLVVVVGLGAIALFGTLLYVVAHFITKYW